MAKKRKWGISNPFSEGHREYLPSNYCLFDVDGILLNHNGDPEFLYESKYKMSYDGSDFIESFYNPKNTQAFFLRHISQKIGVYIHEEKTNQWWFLKDRDLNISLNPRLDLIKTENRIYVEDIIYNYLHNLSGVFVRTEGEKPSYMERYGAFIAQKMGIPNILVNDVFESSYIHFKKENNTYKCDSKSNWELVWEDLDIVGN